MSITKQAGIIGALICITLFAFLFGQIHFGYYTPAVPQDNLTPIKCCLIGLVLVSIWTLIKIIRAPALGRPR